MITCEFAGLEQARTILCTRDAYIKAQHPHEWALKMQCREPAPEEAYLAFLARNVREWNAGERAKLESAVQALNERLAERQMPLAAAIVFVKTTGSEEWNSAYTRANAIILPEPKLRKYPDPLALQRLLAHEVFHVISRENPLLRTTLYESIGFHRLAPGGLTIPETLRARMLTNPDAPYRDHYLTLAYRGEPVHVVPIMTLQARLATVDSSQDILKSLRTQLLVIACKKGQWRVAWDGEHPRLLDPSQVTAWPDVLDGASDTELDPEEILAEQFAGLLTEEYALPLRGVRAGMKAVLDSQQENHRNH